MNTMTFVALAHTPRGHLVANAVQMTNPEMQVGLAVQAGYASSQIYMLASEARQLAKGLLEAADAYDAAQAGGAA